MLARADNAIFVNLLAEFPNPREKNVASTLFAGTQERSYIKPLQFSRNPLSRFPKIGSCYMELARSCVSVLPNHTRYIFSRTPVESALAEVSNTDVREQRRPSKVLTQAPGLTASTNFPHPQLSF
jgi:hypothetical protein